MSTRSKNARGLNLTRSWSVWCSFVDALALGAEGSRSHEILYERLARFSPRHVNTPEHVETVRDVLYRGVPLLLAALGWEEPTAGSRGAKNVQTDRARGDQWRLVIAYGGFETVARGLLANPSMTYLEPADFDALLANAPTLPRFAPIPSPQQKEAVRDRWFAPEVLAAPRHPLLTFLGLTNGDAEIVYRWLVEGQPIDSWQTALRLAQTLRNVTAHGALSASKTREWKLRPVCQRLTQDLATVTAAAIGALFLPELNENQDVTANEARVEFGRDSASLLPAKG